ncbi:MAG: glutathione S-transferase family protein [Pseudomonadota bacterium]
MRLHQFAYSHFNEKVRWALAWKALPACRQTYLPGPHMRQVAKLSGQSQTPVLQHEDEVVVGSAAIIDWLERQQPVPVLYPADRNDRLAALALQAELDAGYGPAVRRLVFSVLVDDLGYLARMFASQTSAARRLAYRFVLPLVKPLMVKGNGLSPDAVRQAEQDVANTMDRMAERLHRRSYLFGESFSVADLTLASLTAPLTRLTHEDMAKPEPVPDAMQALMSRYADHPVTQWTQACYLRHRCRAAG